MWTAPIRGPSAPAAQPSAVARSWHRHGSSKWPAMPNLRARPGFRGRHGAADAIAELGPDEPHCRAGACRSCGVEFAPATLEMYSRGRAGGAAADGRATVSDSGRVATTAAERRREPRLNNLSGAAERLVESPALPTLLTLAEGKF